MKKIVAIVALMVAPAISFAQSIFDQLEDMNNVSSVVVNKDAFEILSKFSPDDNDGNEAMEAFKMLTELKELRMFSTDDKNTSVLMENLVKKEVKSAKLVELIRAKDDGARFKIYVRTNKNSDFVSEVLMYVNNIEGNNNMKMNINTIVVSLTGNINLNKIKEYANKLEKQK